MTHLTTEELNNLLPQKMGSIYQGNYWTGLPVENPPGAPLADFITMGQAIEYGRECVRAALARQAVPATGQRDDDVALELAGRWKARALAAEAKLAVEQQDQASDESAASIEGSMPPFAAPASQRDADYQWVFDLAAEHETRAKGLYGPVTFNATGLLNFALAAGEKLASGFREGRNTKPDSNEYCSTPAPKASGATEDIGRLLEDLSKFGGEGGMHAVNGFVARAKALLASPAATEASGAAAKIQVAKLTAHDGSSFHTNECMSTERLQEVAQKMGGIAQVDLIEMTEAEYFSIPATNESASVFAAPEQTENRAATEQPGGGNG